MAWTSKAIFTLVLGGALGLANEAGAQNAAAMMTAHRYAAMYAAAVAQSDLGNLSIVNSGDIQYRWSRDGVSFDLCRRAKPWTREEAIFVRDALDKLPATYIQKAAAGGLKKFMRDGARPDAPWSFISSTESSSAVAVPPAPWNYTAYSDSALTDANRAYGVITHELGHCVQWNEGGWGIVTGTPFTRLSWVGISEPFGLRSWNGFVSDYARTNHREDFADTCKFYWLAPVELARVNPAKYVYMRDKVFGGAVSPAAARLDYKAVDPLKPAITSLGDSSDDWYSLVQVRGTSFMGPFDGGFNEVRYRGVRATHVPVSRGLIYSWVPAIDEGQASITVRTQDGTSNAVGFRVEEPWWHFW